MRDEMWTLPVALILCAFVVGMMTGLWMGKKNAPPQLAHEQPTPMEVARE